MPTIEVSDLELEVVKAALDVFMRTRIGQIEQVMAGLAEEGVRHDGRALTAAETSQVNTFLREAAYLLTGSRGGGPGIFAERVAPEARLAYRVLARLNGDAVRESMVDDTGARTP